jgi:CHASE2 domain-containing sensor protein
MLQLTPPYPKGVMAALTGSLPIALLLFTLAWFLPAPLAQVTEGLALLLGMASAVAFALATPWLPPQAALPGLSLLTASGVVLEVNLLRARRIFLAHGGRL